MKHKYFLFALLLFAIRVNAQLKDPSYSISLIPTLGNRMIIYKTDVSKHVKDSIAGLDRWRDAVGGSFMLGFNSGRNRRIFIGLQFHNFGFTRRRENYRFMDTIHPEIGIMNDLSQTGGNYVDFNHRYMYLSVPFLFSQQISGKKLKSSTVHFIFGGSLSGLVRHDVHAQLRGFSTKGKKEFILDDDGAEPGLLNGNLHAALRLENLVYGKNTFVFVQPTLYVPLLNANYGNQQRYHLYAIGVEVGLMYKPEKDK